LAHQKLYPNRQQDEGEAGAVEAFLDGEDGVIVEPARGGGVLREKELAAEKDAVGEFRDDLRASWASSSTTSVPSE